MINETCVCLAMSESQNKINLSWVSVSESGYRKNCNRSMASFNQGWSIAAAAAVVLVVIASEHVLQATCKACPYTSIVSFGDSLADTGNLNFTSPQYYCYLPPYGQTYFHHPSGRCSDGRLIIDFIAEYFGFPFVKPYMGIKNAKFGDWSVDQGVNFAVAGATALDVSFFEEKGIDIPTDNSLSTQMNWFKEFLPSICNSSTSCQQVLGNSLFLAGEIGGNDFNYYFFQNESLAEIKSCVPHVLNVITSAIRELIDLGARTLVVPGNWPIGCNAIYLTIYETNDKSQYDSAGCLIWLNEFAQYYNHKLQTEINTLRRLYPHATIIYADYYSATLPLYTDPTKFGFTGGLKACCGKGGPYNYNPEEVCGDGGVVACEDPSQYISWDGIHLTEAAYRFIAQALLDGTSSVPNFSTLCFMNHSFEYFHNHTFLSSEMK